VGNSSARQLAGLRVALSVASFAFLTVPATVSPALAQNASCVVNGNELNCEGISSGGVANSSGPTQVTVNKGAVEESLTNRIGINVWRYGVAGASAADAETAVTYETTTHDINGVSQTVVSNDAIPPVPLLVDGYYIRKNKP
jgi:hypothetical protein